MRFLGFSVCRFTPQFVHLQKMISQRVILGLERERVSERGERENKVFTLQILAIRKLVLPLCIAIIC